MKEAQHTSGTDRLQSQPQAHRSLYNMPFNVHSAVGLSIVCSAVQQAGDPADQCCLLNCVSVHLSALQHCRQALFNEQ